MKYNLVNRKEKSYGLLYCQMAILNCYGNIKCKKWDSPWRGLNEFFCYLTDEWNDRRLLKAMYKKKQL